MNDFQYGIRFPARPRFLACLQIDHSVVDYILPILNTFWIPVTIVRFFIIPLENNSI